MQLSCFVLYGWYYTRAHRDRHACMYKKGIPSSLVHLKQKNMIDEN